MQHQQSALLYQEALTHIAGGVNSPSRSFKAVGGSHPVFMARGEGAYFYDVDNNRYIDYLAAYGPIILGHAHPQITAALVEAAQSGTLYGTPTEREVTFAKLLKSLIPAMDKVRFVNSGTEAVMTTIRLARAHTGRSKIIKFAGCYHGHFDAVLVAAGSGPSTLGTPDSAGITDGTAKEIITVPYNDLPALEAALNKWGEEIAAVMIEPIVGNFGIVPPHEGYLEQLCSLARANGSLVIYDEVISAFRFHYGAAHTHPMFPDHEAVRPDLIALGKIIGGGLPIGAYGGRDEIMRQVAPEGTAYQAGTMAGNPASMATGIACIQALGAPDVYPHLEMLGQKLQDGLQAAANQAGIPLQINRLCGALSTHFYEGAVTNYEHAKQSDGDQFARFFMGMLHAGICLAPSKYEAWFLTTAHQERDIEETIEAANNVLQKLNESK